MHLSEISDIGSTDYGTKVVTGDHLKITKTSVKEVDGKGMCAEIETSNSGKRYSFAAAIVGSSKSDQFNAWVDEAVKKDASDGLDVWVVTKASNTSPFRPMLSFVFKEPATA